MPRQSVSEMKFATVYALLISKAERKGRTRQEVNEVASWLTGYTEEQIESMLVSDMTYGEFFAGAPEYNPRSELITGRICGVRVETIEDPFMKKVRQLDKLIDELAKGKPLEKVLR